jgi:sterol desaturase/sphingolipid hydroxylase (fatty acid hydroxylase superfamily)
MMEVPVTALLWSGIVAVPLLLTSNDGYKQLYPTSWYDSSPRDPLNPVWPSPLGLSLGILAVVVGQVFVLLYFFLRRAGLFGKIVSVQKAGSPSYNFVEGLMTHLGQPEGFVMLGGYLIGTWMFRLMPQSYYSFEGGIVWWKVGLQLLLQDLIQYLMHLVEHKLDARLYKASHKPHHKFTNPRMFDAFNGSPTDTFLMILVPLMITARLVNANVWTYMAFGSLYANWLTLIHCEYAHPWDGVFRLGLGLGWVVFL